MKLNLELSEALVARIDTIARIQNTSREMSVVAALQAWYAHPRTIDFGDFQIYRDGPGNTRMSRNYPQRLRRTFWERERHDIHAGREQFSNLVHSHGNVELRYALVGATATCISTITVQEIEFGRCLHPERMATQFAH